MSAFTEKKKWPHPIQIVLAIVIGAVLISYGGLYINKVLTENDYCLYNSKYSIVSDGTWYRIKDTKGKYLLDYAIFFPPSVITLTYAEIDASRYVQVELKKGRKIKNIHEDEEYTRLVKRLASLKQRDTERKEEAEKNRKPRQYDSLNKAVKAANSYIERNDKIEYGKFEKVCCD